jgi:hypothetical protein
MNKLSAIIDLFRKGSEVANAEAWKKGQITANTVIALLAAIAATARAFGYPIPVDNDSIAAIGGGLFALVNLIFTVVSSSRAGLLPAKVQPEPLPTLDSNGDKPTDWKSVAERDFNAERG